jgi:hypothetical protein
MFASHHNVDGAVGVYRSAAVPQCCGRPQGRVGDQPKEQGGQGSAGGGRGTEYHHGKY